MEAPVVIKPIPNQVINERASFGPFDLKEFIQSPDNSELEFRAELTNGASLPHGMICTGDGILTGIPGKDTQGNYEVNITAENEAGTISAVFVMTIKPSLATSSAEYSEQLKSKVWEALKENLPIPDLGELYDRPVTPLEIYHLLERWAILTIWDAFNLEPAGEKKLLTLPDVGPHYNIYDRGSCLVAAPKDLFSHERTIADSLQAARAIGREVYQRGWAIEFAGFEKMVRAAWVEMQLLGDQHGKRLEILHFDPTFKELRVYNEQSKEAAIKRMDRS